MMLTNFYLYLRHGFGLSKSFRFAFGVTLRDALRELSFWVFIVAVLAFTGGYALNELVDESSASVVEQNHYIKSLETILDKCLRPGDNALVVGGELAYCGLAMTGIKV